jgi:hypothetical protein
LSSIAPKENVIKRLLNKRTTPEKRKVEEKAAIKAKTEVPAKKKVKRNFDKAPGGNCSMRVAMRESMKEVVPGKPKVEAEAKTQPKVEAEAETKPKEDVPLRKKRITTEKPKAGEEVIKPKAEAEAPVKKKVKKSFEETAAGSCSLRRAIQVSYLLVCLPNAFLALFVQARAQLPPLLTPIILVPPFRSP